MSLLGRPFLHETTAPPEKKSCMPVRIASAVGWALFLVFCSVACIVLFKISYPKPSYSLWAWLALAPFTWAMIYLRGFWRSFFYAWLTGTGVYAVLYYWIFITCRDGGNLSNSLSIAAWLGLSVLMALRFAVFGGSCFFLKRLKSWFPLLAAMGWVALEWLQEVAAAYAVGFPWFSLAYSQWNLPQFIQLASITGAAGISFVIAFTGISVGYGFAAPRLRTCISQFSLAAIVFLAVYTYGYFALKNQPRQSLLHLRAAIMQPNIDQYKKWSPAYELEIKDTLEQLGQHLVGQDIMLTVWPENVTPGPVQEEPYLSWMAAIAQASHSWQLAGSYREEGEQQYISAYLFNSQGEVVSFYDKRYLVPFGEFIPLQATLQQLFPDVEVLGELGMFSSGKEQPLLHLGQIALGSTICYESAFSNLWREQTRQGARFFINITNDAWFFDTDAPYQHLAVSVLRAVETRRPVLRAANTGISAFISPAGRLISQAPLNTQAILLEDISLPLGADISFYVRWGNWFAWLCAIFYFTVLISAVVFLWE